jgi:hypothetical protein
MSGKPAQAAARDAARRLLKTYSCLYCPFYAEQLQLSSHSLQVTQLIRQLDMSVVRMAVEHRGVHAALCCSVISQQRTCLSSF